MHTAKMLVFQLCKYPNQIVTCDCLVTFLGAKFTCHVFIPSFVTLDINSDDTFRDQASVQSQLNLVLQLFGNVV